MIKEREYKKRRDRLSLKLKKDSFAIVFSAQAKTRSNDTEFPYRQNSNFYYLTGFKEDKAALVFVKGKKKTKTYLFVEKKDEFQELWHGKRLGEKEAKKHFDVDDVFIIDDLKEKLNTFQTQKRSLYYDFSLTGTDLERVEKLFKNFNNVIDLAPLIGLMRLKKSKAELALIKSAIDITKEAHHKMMSVSKKGLNEYHLQAELEYVFKKNGAYNDAYTSIVACGEAANTLHYVANDQILESGRLILIDAGCEYQYYASDITRTIPVDGKFSKGQKELYNMVLEVQKKIIKMIKPKVLRSDLQKKSVKLLTKGLVDLGILKGDVKKLIEKEKYKKYYPHGIGHWMGIDVHDESPYQYSNGDEIPLDNKMVLTIEPAIYIAQNDKKVPKRYRGTGIRIEDDILVTKDGFKNLSKKIVKKIKDIEKLSS